MDRTGFKHGTKIVALISLWVFPALIFFAALRYDWEKVWGPLAVHPVAPPFLDVRVLTSGVRTFEHGGDPLVANPFDQFQRPLNYPRVWLYLFLLLHIHEQHAWLVGLVFGALYLSCISKLILEGKSPWEQLILLVAGLSVAPLFALERGNIDLVVFAVVFFGTVSASASRRAGVFLLAAMLKLYPAATLAVEAIRQRGKNRVWPVAMLGVAVVGLAAQLRDLMFVARGTPISPCASYGVLSIREALWVFFVGHSLLGHYAFVPGLVAILGCLVGGLVLVLRVLKSPARFDRDLLESRAGELFFIFGAIYVLSFTIGSNWDYRLIFVVPTLPFAFELMRTPRHFRLGVGYLVCVLLAENWVASSNNSFKLLSAEVVTTVLFFLMLSMLVEHVKYHVTAKSQSALAVETELSEPWETLAAQ